MMFAIIKLNGCCCKLYDLLYLKAVLTENYAKYTFQAPCCCLENGLTMDLLLFKTINMSFD